MEGLGVNQRGGWVRKSLLGCIRTLYLAFGARTGAKNKIIRKKSDKSSAPFTTCQINGSTQITEIAP